MRLEELLEQKPHLSRMLSYIREEPDLTQYNVIQPTNSICHTDARRLDLVRDSVFFFTQTGRKIYPNVEDFGGQGKILPGRRPSGKIFTHLPESDRIF